MCGLCFSDNSHLKRHLRTHSEEKPFKPTCDLCGLCFSDNSHLKRHRHTHTFSLSYITSTSHCLMQMFPGLHKFPFSFVALLTSLLSGDSIKHNIRSLYSLTIQVIPLPSTCSGVHILEARGTIIRPNSAIWIVTPHSSPGCFQSESVYYKRCTPVTTIYELPNDCWLYLFSSKAPCLGQTSRCSL